MKQKPYKTETDSHFYSSNLPNGRTGNRSFWLKTHCAWVCETTLWNIEMSPLVW